MSYAGKRGGRVGVRGKGFFWTGSVKHGSHSGLDRMVPTQGLRKEKMVARETRSGKGEQSANSAVGGVSQKIRICYWGEGKGELRSCVLIDRVKYKQRSQELGLPGPSTLL